MAINGVGPIIQHLRRTMLRRDGAGMTDGQLLEEFVARRDEAAFEALVGRHGPMVLGVCRRVLRNSHDAEDAFQATFLVLARKAASVSPREMVGNWLYGVAHTTAIRARAANAKRRARERQVTDMPEPEAARKDLRDDLHQCLDEELARLPDKYRLPIVLCDLEGRTRREVARQLKLPEGTLSSRLTTGRRMLAKRLTRRGLAVSGGTFAMAAAHEAASACVPVSLVKSTAKAATLVAANQTAIGLISVPVAALTEGVLKAMFLTKIKAFVVVMLMVAALSGAARMIYPTRAAEPAKARQANEGPKASKSEEAGLQGTWKAMSLEVDGAQQGSDALLKKQPIAAIQWTFTDNKIKIGAGDKSIEADYTRDSSKAPKRIDLTFHFQDDDVEEVVTALGIYSLDGDALKVCFIIDPQLLVRPLKFETKNVEGTIYYTFRRAGSPEKKADKEKPSVAKPNAKPKTDKERLQGTWKIVRVQGPWKFVSKAGDGEERYGDLEIVGEWTFKGTTIKVQSQQKDMKTGATTEYFRFRLDETTNPKRIDFVGAEADDLFDTTELDKRLDDADERKEGVYSLDGDALIIRIGGQNGERPATCESEQGSKHRLIVLKKESPENKFPDGRKHDFGKVQRGALLKHTFRIVNTSDVPLQLTSVRVSSGCMTGSVDKKVLQPNERGIMEITVDTRRFVGPKIMGLLLETKHRGITETFPFSIKADSVEGQQP
jgi:RNA polymerase sigma-70 factor (ECF subfamily)